MSLRYGIAWPESALSCTELLACKAAMVKAAGFF